MADRAALLPAGAAAAVDPGGDWQVVVDGLRSARRVDLRRLQRLIVRAVADHVAHELRADISQEVMFKIVCAARRDLIRQPSALPRFVRAVARNGAVNWIAGSAARRRRELEAGLDALAAAESVTGERDLDLKRALAALPEQVREVVTGLYWHGATYDELARRLGVSVVTIKRRRAQAICALRRRLQG